MLAWNYKVIAVLLLSPKVEKAKYGRIKYEPFEKFPQFLA